MVAAEMLVYGTIILIVIWVTSGGSSSSSGDSGSDSDDRSGTVPDDGEKDKYD
jgi:hypothetical protein